MPKSAAERLGSAEGSLGRRGHAAVRGGVGVTTGRWFIVIVFGAADEREGQEEGEKEAWRLYHGVDVRRSRVPE